MCGVFGNYDGRLDAEFLESLMVKNKTGYDFKDRYAIRPTNHADVIRLDESGNNVLEPMVFGLIPSWSKFEKVEFSTFNARSETVAETRTYMHPFKKRRGLVLAKHFFEFHPIPMDNGKPVKVPYCFAFKDRRPFVMAVIWDENSIATDKTIRSFSIITTPPISVVKPYHHRSPLILTPEDALKWVNPDAEEHELRKLMQTTDGTEMEAWEVSRLVNNYRNPDSKQLIEPI